MEILKINPDKLGRETIRKIVDIIKKGGTIIYPTDTVYGLGVNALDEKAIKKVFEIKQRDVSRPISIIVRDVKMARQVAIFGHKTEKVLEKIFPGPITVILYKKKILPDILTGGSRKIGLRIPDCKFTQALMDNLDVPITTTSANISGLPSSGEIKEIISQFKNSLTPDLVLDAGDLPKSLPSTVVDLTSSEPKVIRTGPISKENLFKLLNHARHS